MNKYILIVFLFCFSFNSNAQQNQDSTKNTFLQKQLFFTDSIETGIFNFAKLSPLFVDKLLPEQINRITIGHQLEQGKFVTAQGSTKTNTAILKSDGIIKLAKIKLYGSFSYNKVFEDSTRFAHQTRNNTSTPYYFGSPANNHYERSIYNFETLASKNFFSEKINIGLGLKYNIADHFSNNDPRGSLKEYQINIKGSLGYNFNKNIRLGFTYNTGYGQETVNIGYKNRAYYESILYPNYVNYLINGYGEPNPKVNDRQYNDHENRNGVDVTFMAENTSIGSFYIISSKIKEKQKYDFTNGEGIFPLANYDLDELNLNVFWIKRINNKKLSLNFSYQNLVGKDFNLNFSAKNYIYTKNNINLKVNYTVNSEKKNQNFNLSINQLDEERLDGITGNNVYFKNMIASTSYGVNKVFGTNKSIGATLGVHYALPLTDEFLVGTSVESYFTRQVIFHDYIYNTASRLGGSFGANYSCPFYDIMQGAVKVNLVYTTNAEMKSLQRTLVTTPGNDRFFSNISFNLYF